MDPNILPIAKSICFFKAAINPVTNSGNEVPKATIVIPIAREPNCNKSAIFVALSTTKWLPNAKATIAKIIKIILKRTNV